MQDHVGSTDLTTKAKVRLLAYYLPQYHPIPENDEWWGKGFTEWTTVAKARPLYKGHRQPRLPADLGFYDLRLPEAREAQTALARQAGIEGFVYWHYWFGSGDRILERPMADILMTGEPDFPFCLAWANESWSRRWNANDQTILKQQLYPGKKDFEEHFRAIEVAFHDPRYIRVDGKPLFVVYRPQDLPDPQMFNHVFRSLATDSGLTGIYLVGGNNLVPLSQTGFDANYLQPSLTSITAILSSPKSTRAAIARKFFNAGGPVRVDYADLMTSFRRDVTHARASGDPTHLGVIPNWDNTPRRGRGGIVVENTSPEALREEISYARARTHSVNSEAIMFLKSWNEWAEGNYVEPDAKDGRAWIEAIGEELNL